MNESYQRQVIEEKALGVITEHFPCLCCQQIVVWQNLFTFLFACLLRAIWVLFLVIKNKHIGVINIDLEKDSSISQYHIKITLS